MTGCFPLCGASEEGAFCSDPRGPGVLRASPSGMEDVGAMKEVCSVWDTNILLSHHCPWRRAAQITWGPWEEEGKK